METATQLIGIEEVPATPGSAAKLIREVRAQTRIGPEALPSVHRLASGYCKSTPLLSSRPESSGSLNLGVLKALGREERYRRSHI